MQQSDADFEPQAPIVVAGMHRSGTSFVSSLLRQAGVDMGARLLPASRGNELGHFENADFVAFHQAQLILQGYDDAGWVSENGVTPNDEGRVQAEDIVAQNARRSPWGWKDPRTTLFLDFWNALLPRARFVFLYREPAEVVDSLFRRGDSAVKHLPRLALEAWTCHNRHVLRFARAHRERCIIAHVERVAQNSRAFLELVAGRFGVDIDVDSASPFDPRALHVRAHHSRNGSVLRYFSPAAGDLYEELQSQAELPAGAAASARISKPQAVDAFFSQWLANAASESQGPALRLAPPAAQEAQTAADQAQVDAEVARLRDELESYEDAVRAFASQVDRCLGVTDASKTAG